MILWTRGFLSTDPGTGTSAAQIHTLLHLMFALQHHCSFLGDVLVLPQLDTWACGGHYLSMSSGQSSVSHQLSSHPVTENNHSFVKSRLWTQEQTLRASCLTKGLYAVSFLCTVAFAFKGWRFKTVGMVHFRINWEQWISQFWRTKPVLEN